MLTIVLSSVAGAVLLTAGWLASAWYHGRKLDALQRHLKTVKQTHAEHGEQMKRQIGQLQAELATHKAAVPPARRAPPPILKASLVDATLDRKATLEAMLAGDGFPATLVVGKEGFAATEVMR